MVYGPSRFLYAVPEDLAEYVPAWAGLYTVRQAERYSHCTLQRHAPRLHSHKVQRAFVDAMRTAAYWRYWHHRAPDVVVAEEPR